MKQWEKIFIIIKMLRVYLFIMLMNMFQVVGVSMHQYQMEIFLSHFRVDVNKFFKSKFSGSIRKVTNDYDYVSYFLKNHTTFCSI